MAAAHSTELRIPFATLLKVALFALLVVITIKLWPVIIMLFVAALIAVVLDPLVEWMQRHSVRRGLGIAVVGFALFGVVALFVFVIVPAMPIR